MATQTLADPRKQGKHGSEAQIDQVNQWMRGTDWYQAYLRAWGQKPDSVKLTKAQRKTLLNAARAQGVEITDDVEIDPGGNFNPKGHKLRNTLIVAGIAGATIATMGAAGVFAGAGGAAGAGSGAAAGGAAAAAGAGIPAAATTAAVTGGTTAAVTAGTRAAAAGAGARGSGLWGNVARTALEVGVPAGAAIFGTKMQVDANKAAADAELEAAREALDWQKQVFAIRQRQLAPTIGVGNQATMQLGHLMGYKPPEGGYQPELPTDYNAGGTAQPRQPAPQRQPGPTPPTAPTAQPRAAGTQGGQVLMRSPNNQLAMVPANAVEHYKARGAVIVQEGV